jgi:hypothetical protein
VLDQWPRATGLDMLGGGSSLTRFLKSRVASYLSALFVDWPVLTCSPLSPLLQVILYGGIRM